MLSGERVALNFLQRLCGIATMTDAFVRAAASGGRAEVLDTRKTTPGLRELERYAVRAGGGRNHRNTLEDGVLIKDNHIAAAALRGVALDGLVQEARWRASHTLRIEVEADSEEQARAAIEAGADIVLLDNMTPELMTAIVQAAPGGVLFEASGGITLETVAAAAASGVDLISVGALTHSAPSLDISLEIEASQ
jgi:nicotinate-nucleotide pyrophosphorylase (carboxylating)